MRSSLSLLKCQPAQRLLNKNLFELHSFSNLQVTRIRAGASAKGNSVITAPPICSCHPPTPLCPIFLSCHSHFNISMLSFSHTLLLTDRFNPLIRIAIYRKRAKVDLKYVYLPFVEMYGGRASPCYKTDSIISSFRRKYKLT